MGESTSCHEPDGSAKAAVAIFSQSIICRSIEQDDNAGGSGAVEKSDSLS